MQHRRTGNLCRLWKANTFAKEEPLASTKAEDRRLRADLLGKSELIVASQALWVVQTADERRRPAVDQVG